MDYKVFVFSDEVLKGRLKFDYELFNQICLYNLVNITYFQVDKYDEKKRLCSDRREPYCFLRE